MTIRLYNELYDRITKEADMGTNLKKLGEAELEIMQVIWKADAPITSSFILKELQERICSIEKNIYRRPYAQSLEISILS